ncbi:MAG: RNA polymerase sigma factor [Solirubrobacteraceae bacterium]
MHSNDSDARLLAAVAAGDRHAFDPLIDRHHVAVHRYVARRIGVSEAEDIASETFEVAFRRASAFRPIGDDARPWLLGIATNLLRRHARREAAMYRAYARTGVDAAAVEDIGGDEMHAALAGVLATMRRSHRDALLLYALGELSYDEVAAALDVSVGTVKAWLHRARAVAADQLNKAGLGPATATTETTTESGTL